MVTEAFSPGFKRIVAEHVALEKVAGGFTFTEGPVWNGREKYLVWTDIIGDAIWKWVPGQGTSLLMRPSGKADGMTFDLEGRLVVAGWSNRTVWRLEPDGSTVTLASHYHGKKLNTPNDIVVKSDGFIYFTDPSNGIRNIGMEGEDVQKYIDYEGVYRLNPGDSSLTLLLDDMVNPNGLCFSPDESLLYINDTPRRHIRVFNVGPDGAISNGRLFTELIHDDAGAPDGMKVDVEGNVYCTGPGGVWVMDSQGNPLGRILIPEHCANLTFGGEDLRTLFFTARSSVYRMRVKLPGIPTYPRE
jgi:gluconolactonase